MPSIPTLADVCMVPLGTGSPSVSDFVTKIEKKIRESPLKSTLHSAGTTIEGPWDDVMKLIGELHEYSHELGYVRVHTDIRVGTRTDKVQTAEDKVNAVLSKLDQ
ncbi:Ecm15p [Kluyveromyces lactis]|uniref:KLLA0E17315p n=1 Tax=Kluyveromyces lactis (strain ATCC 8585 / CBS 2359 / DSM 70799 / NBRC 1267 / NRRL Y-1140 / WM37) TaxID=284590 RepID=B4UN74_KLULA|nr:uncharacterized protein KLLA0_E17315g [Kluyveromyces lactis]CAR56745.1 KLLA0E17315p [Kluyveromyces lactis]|eukprot:XP_002999407.1 uncharacterized protein KLLA0_E17315g [Kluyveromyces lactis]